MASTHGPSVSRKSTGAPNGPVAGILNTSWLFASPASTVPHSPLIHPAEFRQSANHSIRSALEKLDALSSTFPSHATAESQEREAEFAKCLSSGPSDDAWYLESKELFHMLSGEHREQVLASSSVADAEVSAVVPPSEDTREADVADFDQMEADGEQSTTILGQKKLKVDRLLKEARWQSLTAANMLPVPPACRPQLSPIPPPIFQPVHPDAPSSVPFIQPDQPTLMSISIHHPRHPHARTHQLTLSSAKHTLADLRDHIFCPTDYMTDNDKLCNDPRAGHRKTSPSVFLIEDVMYVDGRAGYRAVDAAVPIIKYFESRGKGQMPRHAMEETRLDNVATGWRINVPYVFVHQGGCEHMILVQDIRYVSYPHFSFFAYLIDPIL
ncbi:snRNA-activating protein of 50kDa MW C terminal-domain-containing protein [Catenaria anguillulae PL171]|uniref:snRNA-activating protein of 50kDa MW C terminal-domain-containing protein n=1 Tax=Catenaria anguillulae PL171 TaxID=765915 RepID=A0A1Y2H7S3_9FUNG|nr:snRNA-activating protein of 50kDa MW C terminal-domain-containing protein [Catenaria anguillulae PL171]